jgi:predicted dehydrogenase
MNHQGSLDKYTMLDIILIGSMVYHFFAFVNMQGDKFAAMLTFQMGYMFRYHEGFRKICEWVKSGLLGEIFAVRAHMSTCLNEATRDLIGNHIGGVFYDLAGHMLDQIVWLLGRPQRVTSFLRNDSRRFQGFVDNGLGVFEFERAMAYVDIAAMEPRPMARRYEVYGSNGSAIITEPFEPARTIRLCLDEAGQGFGAGEHIIALPHQTCQNLYELELEAFLRVLRGEQTPDRLLSHDLLVQETLLRATDQAGADRS